MVHPSRGIFIFHHKYLIDLLKSKRKLVSKSASTPLNPNHKLCMVEEETYVDHELYHCHIGQLLQLTYTRPYIPYAVDTLSQFMYQPKEYHLHEACQVPHYLKGTSSRRVLFKRSEKVEVEMFTDVDFG